MNYQTKYLLENKNVIKTVKVKKNYKIYTILIALFISITTFGKDDCFPKKTNRLVNDYVGILSPSQQNQLESKLINFANQTTTQIAIVIIKDLCGYDRAMYATEIGQKWGVGQKGFDNGVVILVKPTGGQGQRQTFIAVGYGLEGVIPDAIAKRIVEIEMLPRFKNNDIAGGLDAAINTIMGLAKGEFTASEYNRAANRSALVPLFFILLIVFIVFASKYQRAKNYSRVNGMSIFAAWALLNAASRSHRGHYGGFSSGGGSFGGFGGGGFGGGGAGGSW